MPTQKPPMLDDSRLLEMELNAARVSEVELGAGPEPGQGWQRYLEVLPPQTAVDLIRQLRELHAALHGAVTVLESAGYTLEAYYALDERERESPAWRAVRRAREACGAWPEYVMRYTRGSQEHSRIFPSRQAALNGAIEVIETREGYPRAIDVEGRHLMNCDAILHEWEDRHDPG